MDSSVERQVPSAGNSHPGLAGSTITTGPMPETGAAITSIAGRRMTSVLIVEDEPSAAEALDFLMSGQGFRVERATSGPQALDRFLDRRPELILLDLMIPVINGIEVCRRIRAASDVPVIVITARSAEAEKVVALEAGADDYLTKPFSHAELLARVGSIMRRRPPGPAAQPFEVGPLPSPRSSLRRRVAAQGATRPSQ